MSAVIDLLRELVAIPSVSGSEEACRDHLGGWLARHGIEPTVVGRNLLASVEGTAGPAAGVGRGLLLCSHYDVVPVGPGWTREPWDAALEDGKVFGRGSNDAKSAIAAMAVAATQLAPASFSGRLALAFVCDEETGGEGIEACLEHLPACTATVVGEPTQLDVCRGQRGLFKGSVVVTGRQCHASRPWEGVNAIEIAARDVLAIQGLAARFGEPDELLGPATLQATVIAGGTRSNVLPGECSIELDGRPTPGCDNETMLALLRQVVQGDVRVRSMRYTPVVTPPDHEIVAAAQAASPSDVMRGFGGVSDLFHLRHLPGVVLGPGTSEASHAPDEWVAVDQVEAAVDTYAGIAGHYLGARRQQEACA